MHRTQERGEDRQESEGFSGCQDEEGVDTTYQPNETDPKEVAEEQIEKEKNPDENPPPLDFCNVFNAFEDIGINQDVFMNSVYENVDVYEDVLTNCVYEKDKDITQNWESSDKTIDANKIMFCNSVVKEKNTNTLLICLNKEWETERIRCISKGDKATLDQGEEFLGINWNQSLLYPHC